MVADDEELIRDALGALLSLEDDLEVVATAADGRSAVETARAHRPDVAVVDVRLPPSFTDEGLRAAIAARTRCPAFPS